MYRLLVATGALLLAAGSGLVQRHGPDQAVYCALGKSQDGFDIFCPRPVLNGGWPAPFLFDRPGISIENRLSPLEDDWRWWPFWADAAFYGMVLAAARAGARRGLARGRRG